MDEHSYLVLEKASTVAIWVGIVLLFFTLLNSGDLSPKVKDELPGRAIKFIARTTLACFVFAFVVVIALIGNAPTPPLVEGGESVSLRVAWQYWFASEELSQIHVLGHSIHSWGRVGKILEGMAGLVIVIDVIGPERLTRWASSLSVGDPWERSRKWHEAFFVPCLMVGAIYALTSLFVKPPAAPELTGWLGFVSGAFVVIILTGAFGLLFWYFQVTMVLVLIGYSGLLAKPAALTVMRSVAAILFVVGFHFDLLAS
jgi:hypothetical protein